MIDIGFSRQWFLAQAQQALLKGTLLIKVALVLRSIAAVRIPGGLTPP